MMIPGEGEVLNELCGTVKGYQVCPECGWKKSMKNNCGRVQCPECYSFWVNKSAKRISQHVHGFSETLKNYPLDGDVVFLRKNISFFPRQLRKSSLRCAHLIISPPQNILNEGSSLKDCYDLVVNHLKEFFPQVVGAEIFFHPFRLKPEIKESLREFRSSLDKTQYKEEYSCEYSESGIGFWEMVHDDVLELGSMSEYRVFSPHFHLLAFGYFPKADEYCESSGGWIYKNKRSVELTITTNRDGTFNDQVSQLCSYLLSHVGVELNEKGRAVKTHRSFGLMTSRYLHKESGYSFNESNYVLCPSCLENDEYHELILTDEELNPLHPQHYDMDNHCMITDTSEPAHVRSKMQVPLFSLSNPKPRVKRVRKFVTFYDASAFVLDGVFV